MSVEAQPEVALEGKSVGVVGLGGSGVAAAHLLLARRARVFGFDARPAIKGEDELRSKGASLALENSPFEGLENLDLLVVSPGVPDLPELREAETSGVRVVSEIELASWFLTGRLAAVTGTNGKSTVTELLGLMLQGDGAREAFVGGNLGTPLSTAAMPGQPLSQIDCVVELSSFQLERTESLRPQVAVLLPISQDHLDRYDSFAHYAATKGRIFRNQRRKDVAIVAQGDELTLSLARAGAGQIKTFGSGGDVCLQDGKIVDAVSGLSVQASELALSGEHNLHNACAAALAARELGVPATDIEQVLRSYRGLPHRMEFVAEVEGVSYYDDSKGTNVGASTAAVIGVEGDRKVVLLAGGVDKGGSYDALAEAMAARGRYAVLFGQAAPLIEAAFRQHGVDVSVAKGLEDALVQASRRAEEGDVVLLSPACSSYDMFRDYRERGERFQTAVKSLTGMERRAAQGGQR